MYLKASKNHGKWTVTSNWYTKPEVNHCELIHKAHNRRILALPCLPKHTHTQHRPHKWPSRLTRWGKLTMGPPYRKPRVFLALSFYSGHDTSKDHNTEPKGFKNSLSFVYFISREHLHTGNVQSRTHIGDIFSVVNPIAFTYTYTHIHARTHSNTHIHAHALTYTQAHTHTHTHS